MIPSLCLPDREKSCFACCPPIRPSEYDHIDHKNMIMRIIRENSRAYNSCDREIKPITGFSCWALGYIDISYKQIGCLLHPGMNHGNDLRYRINYGSKCTRENCYEQRVFSSLDNKEKYFWLNLADGMDSFEYSSRKKNVLFKLLGWGNRLLTTIAVNESGEQYSRDRFIKYHPFFETELNPKGHSFLINHIIEIKGPHILKSIPFKTAFEDFAESLKGEFANLYKPSNDYTFVHKLGIDREFSDFLRLTAGIKKANIMESIEIKGIVEKRMKVFCRNV